MFAQLLAVLVAQQLQPALHHSLQFLHVVAGQLVAGCPLAEHVEDAPLHLLLGSAELLLGKRQLPQDILHPVLKLYSAV